MSLTFENFEIMFGTSLAMVVCTFVYSFIHAGSTRCIIPGELRPRCPEQPLRACRGGKSAAFVAMSMDGVKFQSVAKARDHERALEASGAAQAYAKMAIARNAAARNKVGKPLSRGSWGYSCPGLFDVPVLHGPIKWQTVRVVSLIVLACTAVDCVNGCACLNHV
jgi:hypothetical protein